MKKILSLLALLVMTLTAFAADYTGHRTVTFGSMPSTESDDAVLTITDNGDNTFNVTFKDVINVDGNYTDNYGTFIFSNVAGTTENGVTTIDLSNLSASLENCALGLKEASDGVLFAKFNAEKAYAKFSAKIGSYYKSTISAEFGVNDFESTGGGSTGGGDEKPAAFEKVDFVGDGTNFNWSIPVDWDTQKIVMSIDPSTCTGACEDIIGLGEVATAWDNTLHLYRKPDGTLQGYFNVPGGSNNNTNPFDETNPIKVEVSKAKGFVVNDVVKIPASEMSALFALSTVNMGTGEGANDKSRATYNYVKVVDKDWTEPTEPEVTVTFEKQYADQLYSLVDGAPNAMGAATVTLKEMSDNTISMSLDFSNMNVESTDLVKGTDEKDRITYTGTANFQGTNYAVKALRYTENEEDKLYMTLTPTEGTTLAFGTDPDYVAPAEPEDVTLWENYQADGTGFSKTATINWDKQKIVASIDFSNGGDDKDILAMTTGDSFAAFQTSTYRTMHWYCFQSAKQMSGFFAKSGAGNNNTDRIDVADCLAKFEISKAEGLKVNGVVKMTPEALDELFASNTVLIGSGESPKFSQAFYKYIKVVSLDWTEPTTPETPEAVVYNNDLTVVRDADHKVYENAEVTVLAKGEGKYEVTLPEFSDMDLTNGGTVGKIVFEANGEEVDGVLQLTAENAAGVISTGEDWANYAADVTMSGEVENGQLAAKFTVVLGGMSDYTYELGFGKEIFIPTTETITDWANVKFGDSDPVNIENAKLDITMVSATTAKLTFKDVVINGNTIGDFAISDVKASLNPEDYTTVLTTEATNGTWVRTVENNALGVFVGDESDIRNFEGTQDEEAGKTVVKFGVFFGSAYGWADIVFGEKVDAPEPPVEDYAINFDKDAKQTHASRYSTSVSLQQTGKDKQTIEFGKTMNGYEDLTDQKFTVEAGSEVTPSIGYVGEWMHGYVYIDLDNNKQFSFNADGADQTGTEVVSYSYYMDQNSKGETVASSCNVNPMPAFTAPTTPGIYRIRFKVDWDNIDAGGSVASGNYILNNGGGIYDATLEVVEPVVDGISTINAEVANGEAQLFTVDGVQIAKLQKGLNIVRTADGKVKKVLVK